ncbi:hypothetical protein SPBR_03138 [Sporothrix brasiliensis 5110]|uniref:Autophagy-related protein 33 n=1 Tax=Sporothrix brasiliensis 5110 TaxID=1398154 RepID=A0A0C2FPB3_9PEZI|nr:uncharacterized protein SPBR_03138 [Sporothrix brasiliensis 5110]KIH92908.1 hypothetical protein SPBR_03138 [Sporothrix brasiliensis 5110]
MSLSFRGVAVLKFVGTVSLGLLTGLSYTLSTVTVPTLLTLPSARTASNAFRSLKDAASVQIRTLSTVASSAFLVAFFTSPRAVRHPYLLYTALLVIGGRFAASDALAPYLFSSSSSSSSGNPTTDPFAPSSPLGKDLRRSGSALSTSASHMEASYEVLGSATAGSVSGGSVSDAHSDGSAGDDADTPAAGANGGNGSAGVNGEEVRAAVETFLKRQIVRTVTSGLAFGMAIVGLWGDGLRRVPVWNETIIVA